jgi:hypothetical protein
MDLWDVIALLWRRWSVVVPVLVLTLGLVAATYTTSPVRYLSSAVGILTVPPSGSTTHGNVVSPDHSNPLYLADYNLTVAGAMLAQVMSTDDFARQIGLPSDGSTLLAANNGAANPELQVTGPFLFVSVNSASAEDAAAFTRRAIEAAQQVLQREQATLDAPAGTYVTLTTVAPPSEPVPVQGSRIRAAVTTVVLGLIAALASAVAVERRARGRAGAGRQDVGALV